MTVNLQAYGRASVRINGKEYPFGSLEIPRNIAVDGEVHVLEKQIANAANAVMYNDELSTFKYMFIASDFTVRAKFKDTANNEFSLPIGGTNTSGEQGLPLQLDGDETLNSSVTINNVQIFNDMLPTQSNTANVVLFAVK